EPTNHLDVEMIEWLEDYLSRSNLTLLMVTHDRYFLDRVCDHILEMADNQLYHHSGNYGYYLQKRAEREEVQATVVAKASKKAKKEQEWMRRQPKARTTKSKSRIDAYYETEKIANSGKTEQEIRLEVGVSRIGGQVLEFRNVTKKFDDLVILEDFDYSFNKGEKIGIIGKNGVGKSTFLKLITGEEKADSGEIKSGQTIIYGHYRQSGIEIKENERVIDVIKEVAEVIELSNGDTISASKFLEHFMFEPRVQYTPVAKLSGGEKRRLGLMMVLIKNPNFLILDEPTNDLDLITLERLEGFLVEFGGCLIIVSHDRYFMDSLVDHYFVFEGGGVIRDFNGTYEEYRELQKQEEQMKSASKETAKKKGRQPHASEPEPEKKGLTYPEQKEFNKLEKEIGRLEEKIEEVVSAMNQSGMPADELRELSEKYAALKAELEEKEITWLEMAERA
ncbi:MAG: ABC-F family ATP-binding cassette domain-containing protein, partial [Balneolaceae bacterium]|nr:ABC-F family ATP-binding cassette domain-containing protein [Balneolaceae bacterium]